MGNYFLSVSLVQMKEHDFNNSIQTQVGFCIIKYWAKISVLTFTLSPRSVASWPSLKHVRVMYTLLNPTFI